MNKLNKMFLVSTISALAITTSANAKTDYVFIEDVSKHNHSSVQKEQTSMEYKMTRVVEKAQKICMDSTEQRVMDALLNVDTHSEAKKSKSSLEIVKEGQAMLRYETYLKGLNSK